jgi:hypothetical protein
MSISPTQRTLQYLRDEGYNSWIVERYIRAPHLPGGGKRIDLFNIGDLISIKPGEIWLIQSTGQAFSEHHHKLFEEKRQEVVNWLEAGGLFLLIGWRKLKVKRGGKAMRWRPRIREYKLESGVIVWKDAKDD